MVPFIRDHRGSAGSTRQSATPVNRDLMRAQLGFLSEAEVEERFDVSSARFLSEAEVHERFDEPSARIFVRGEPRTGDTPRNPSLHLSKFSSSSFE